MRIFKRFVLSFIFLWQITSEAKLRLREEKFDLKPTTWTEFGQYLNTHEEYRHWEGSSYILSGTIATLGSAWGVAQAADPLSRGLFILTQSAGILAIGYGSSLWFITHEDKIFYDSVEVGRGVSIEQKNLMLQNYLEMQKMNQDNYKRIQMVSHFLVAGLNLYSAGREENGTIKNLQYFLALGNVVMGASYAF